MVKMHILRVFALVIRAKTKMACQVQQVVDENMYQTPIRRINRQDDLPQKLIQIGVRHLLLHRVIKHFHHCEAQRKLDRMCLGSLQQRVDLGLCNLLQAVLIPLIKYHIHDR